MTVYPGTNYIAPDVKIRRKEEQLIYTKGLTHRVHNVERVTLSAPLVGRGYVNFYKLEHGWTCGDCSQRVTIAKFARHVHKEHGFG